MSRARLAVLVLFLAGLIAATVGGLPPLSAAGGPRLAPHVPGEILISFKPGAPGLERASAMAALNASPVQSFRSGGEHWRLGPGVTVEKALERMSRNPHVRYAEPNFILTTDLIPNDPNLPQLYGMINTGQTGGTADADIDADQAWSIARGSHNVIVGIIDTGIDYNHPDLAANIWTNPGETAGNGIDDDGNGFIDDIHGWDFVNNDNDPMDDNGHGTHVAGTIGAVGNNGVGVVGVNWEVSLMGLKFLSAGGSGSTAGAISAVNYTVTMKQAGHNIALTSNSWGGGGFSQAPTTTPRRTIRRTTRCRASSRWPPPITTTRRPRSRTTAPCRSTSRPPASTSTARSPATATRACPAPRWPPRTWPAPRRC
jgi:subtilisin family serine protease